MGCVNQSRVELPTWAQNTCQGGGNQSLRQRAGGQDKNKDHKDKDGLKKPESGHIRTSLAATWRLRCSERNFQGSEDRRPVQLVIFDFDETLTISTFMPKNNEYTEKLKRTVVAYSFESPFAQGFRLPKLSAMLEQLQSGADPRALCILTRNESGVTAVLNLLQAAGLADYFCVIWSMPYRRGQSNGLYRNPDDNDDWTYFSPPVHTVRDHKADALDAIVEKPQDWLPQLGAKTDNKLKKLAPFYAEGLLLVDDERENFQSESGARVLRYCKVARYSATLRKAGWIENLGGIGAHSDADYEALVRFVEEPWCSKDSVQIFCLDRTPDATMAKSPISMVVFDFDETLTMATFMPQVPESATQVGWHPPPLKHHDEPDAFDDHWDLDSLLTWNFESPFREGSRIEKLKKMLAAIQEGPNGLKRTLAVLTRNDKGVIAVLNLLMLAGLDKYFTAIWTQPFRQDSPNGAVKDSSSGKWKTFEPPVPKVSDHKADALEHIVKNTAAWFPCGVPQELKGLAMQNIVLVDDERVNFRSNIAGSNAHVMRYVKVARYDESYRDCGLLNQMGGIGAHTDDDYRLLEDFLADPSAFHAAPYQGGQEQAHHEEPEPEHDPHHVQDMVLSRGSTAELAKNKNERPSTPRNVRKTTIRMTQTLQKAICSTNSEESDKPEMRAPEPRAGDESETWKGGMEPRI